MKYQWMKGVWKGVRTGLIALAVYALANYQDWMPKEYLTPLIILVIEFLRNRFLGNHDKALIKKK